MAAVLETVEEARALARWLRDDARAKPVIVITTSVREQVPWVDVDLVEAGVGVLADVVVLPTGRLTREFQVELPPRTQVYGGASRVYPLGDGWAADPYASPLRFASSIGDAARVAEELITDALGMAVVSELVTERARQSAPAEGVVRGLPVPTRALVQLDDGQHATIHQELTFAGVPLERVVSTGMRVRGLLHPDDWILDIRESALEAEVSLASYAMGDVILARVSEVASKTAQLEVHPDVSVRIGVADVSSSPMDELTSLLTVGEVVAARVTGRGAGAWTLSLLDVDDDEPVRRAVALLDGGPPWLVPPNVGVPHAWEVEAPCPLPAQEPSPEQSPALEIPRPHPATLYPVPEPTTSGPVPMGPSTSGAMRRPTPALLDRRRREQRVTPETPVPLAPVPATHRPEAPERVSSPASGPAEPPTTLPREASGYPEELELLSIEVSRLKEDLRAFSDEHDLLNSQLAQSERRLSRRTSELEQLRTRVRKEVKKRSRVARDLLTVHSGPLFPDDESQFRYEVYLSWARRIPAGEKGARPLRDYEIGPGFLRTVSDLAGVDRAKVVDVVVEVVTGLADQQTGRDMHRLRTGRGGSDGPVVREADGATCWRVALQVNTPQARRLHFWRRNDVLELSRVVRHDDMTP